MKLRLVGPLHCHYCGMLVSGSRLHRDHFKPKKLGGGDSAMNIVPACGPCNSTKGNKTIEDARTGLLLRKLGWPRFNAEQLEWLRLRDFDLSELEGAQLFYETAHHE